MPASQIGRRIAIQTALGPEAVLLSSFDGFEEISKPFSYQLRLLSEIENIAPAEIVGKPATLVVLDVDDMPRPVNGIIKSLANLGTGDRYTIYAAEMVPWFWFLTRRTDCRIFQQKTVPQIITEVFQSLGFSDFELKLQSPYPTYDYVVQYRETDFDFVCRLMEQEGIFYFFRHEAEKHFLVLADQPAAYLETKHHVQFAGPNSFVEVQDDILTWQHRYEFRSGRVGVRDFNFETPQSPVQSRERTLVSLPENSKFELYDYPGGFLERGGGDRRARLLMQEEESPYDVVVGSGDCRFFSPGHTFDVAVHRMVHEVGKKYVLTAVRHRAESGEFFSGNGRPDSYQNEFTCIPASVAFRPPRVTPKSLVQGPQTAKVVGPPGEEIYTDKHGRVKVQFHWDRYGQSNENSSCWIRVSQNWAGKGFGGCAIPRIGQEVIVDFLEGDPDRPMVTGRVYNPDSDTPQSLPTPTLASSTGPKPIPEMQGRATELPAAKTRTTMKSNSTPGGGGANEIAFDDAAGGELFFVNASKDAVRNVVNNDRTSVGVDQELSVGANQKQFVGANRDREVVANETILIRANRTETVMANQTETVLANQSVTIGANHTETVAIAKGETIGAAKALTIGAGYQVSVGAAMNETIGGAKTQEVGAYKLEAVGGDKKSVISGDMDHSVSGKHVMKAREITLDASTKITVQCGASKIELTPATITISAPLVKINC